MKKVLPLLVLVGACAPDIAQDARYPAAVTVRFDLSKKVVPLPNDLAKDPTTGFLVVPDTSLQGTPFDTDAQKEFNHGYLEKLDGFPHESTASVSFDGDLKPESVTAQTVLVLDITNPAAADAVADVTPTYNADTKSIVLAPPKGAWTRGHKYAIALVAGANGLRGKNGEDVIGSESWGIVSGKSPLITCTDPKNLDTCNLLVDVIPATSEEPAARLKEQKTNALQLEQIRTGYNQLLGALELKGVKRADIPQIWTFSIIDSGEVTFDPSKSVIPFPNDVVRDPSTGKVKVPNPKTGQPLTDADCAGTDTTVLLYCGLNTLDGFSTVAPLISENSTTLGALMQGNIAGTSLNGSTVGLAPLRSDAPKEVRTAPQYTPCLNCLSTKDAAGNPQTSPQQLQWKLDAPLDEKTTYAAWVKTDVKDDKGRGVVPNPIFALTRSLAPLVVNGKSAVSVLSDEQANQLEQLRVGYKGMFDALETGALTGGVQVHRSDLALAYPFTTQTEGSALDKLYAYPGQVPNLPDTPLAAITDVTALYTAAAGNAGIPITAVDKFFIGLMVTPVAVTGTGGTLNPANPAIQTIPFVVAVPKGAAPATGFAPLIFGHGITRYKNDFLAFANASASSGHVTIAIDTIFHGDRASCTGAKAFLKTASDDDVCVSAGLKCDEGAPFGLCVLKNDAARNTCLGTSAPQKDGYCLSQNQGKCAADGKCQGTIAAQSGFGGGHLAADASGRPKISGWNILNPANLFASRDNLRQYVIDHAQVVRLIKSTTTGNLGAQLQGAYASATPILNVAKIDYIGQSLGGIQGALFNAVSPDTHNVALNVTGGPWSAILLNTITFKPLVEPLYAALAAQGINPGTPAFDQFVGTLQWILDPADPVNVGYRLSHPVDFGSGVLAPPADRKVFFQFIEGDQGVPNVSSLALVAAANRSFQPVPPRFNCVAPLTCYEFTEKGDTFDATTATADSRHGFLLSPPSGTAGLGLTQKAQTQAATFLATGALP